ncbi:MAG: Os1348 family NHLP clan protein [Gammaproteobacteria bacterium]
MSRQGVAAFLTRVMEDEGFRNQLKASPDATLAQFDLTPDEVTAIKSADPSKIQELGVDERVSKAVSADRYLATDAAAMSQSVASQTWLPQITEILRYVFHP